MDFKINNKLNSLTPYDPINGEFKIRLDANESFINYPEKLINELGEKIKQIDLKRYPDPYSTELIELFSKNNNINNDLVIAGNGSDELIGLIIGSFLEKGNSIAVLTFDFSMYKFYSNLYENKIITIEKNDDLTINVDLLIEKVNKFDCSMLIFSNPCNPTSLGLDKNKIEKIMKNVKCLIVLDEAYMDFFGQSFLDNIENYNNLIILKTCSKAIALAGVRVGFAVSNKNIIKCLKAAKSPYNVNSLSQVTACHFLENNSMINNNIKILKELTKELYKKLMDLNKSKNCFDKIYESQTNFIFIKTRNSDLIFNELKKRSIIIRNFGDYLRITTGSEEENNALINAISENIF